MTPSTGRSGPVRTAAGLLYALMHVRRGSMARPTDHTLVRSGPRDAAARRILLVANGIGHGWGVTSHRAAPAGRLAAAVAERTGAACEVEFVGDAAMSARTAPLWLEGRADRSFDCAVVAIGSNDAMRLTAVDEWEAQLADLLDAVRRGIPEGAPVVVVGVPEVFAAQRVRRMGLLLRRRARRLDAATRGVLRSRPGTVFVTAPDLGAHLGEEPGVPLYTAFAAALTDAVAAAVLPGAASAPAAPESFDHETVRAVVEAARQGGIPELEAILGRVRARFGVMESAVTMVDGGRTWHVAHGGSSPQQVPASLTSCPIVVESDAPLIVEDTERDPRFAANGFLDLEHARFYAGAPVHAPDGSAIGALCLLHAFPRSARRVDLAALQAFAKEADDAIRALVVARALDVVGASEADRADDTVPVG